MIDRDLLCACEYNLRGLPKDGRCPECGRPVQQAMRKSQKPLPEVYRLFRLGLLALCCGILVLVALAGAFRVQHPRHLFYLWGEVAEAGIELGVCGLISSCGIMLFSRHGRQDRIVWSCAAVSLLATYLAMSISSVARE